jgi:dienelactone hydrolase
MRLRHLASLVAVVTALVPSTTASAAGLSSCDPAGVSRVSLTTSDGVSIAGFVQGRGSLGVVLVHQVNQDHCGWATEAAYLAKRATVLSIDLRGYGASSKASGAKALAYRLDIAAAVGSLRAGGATHVVIIGASMGGSAAVVAGAAIDPPVDGVVAVSAPSNFRGQDAGTAAKSLTVPFRAVGASDDGDAAKTAQKLAATAQRSPDAAAITVPKGGHGWALLRPGTSVQRDVDVFVDGLATTSG